MKQLLEKLPPKEQLFFIGAVLFAVYIAAVTPWSTRTFEATKNTVLFDPALTGELGDSRAEAIYKDTQKGITQGSIVGGDGLNIGLQKRFGAPEPKPVIARETPFRPSSQKYLPLPPATLPDVALARVPGFDPPVGIAPEVAFQARAKNVPEGRVRLVRQSDEVLID